MDTIFSNRIKEIIKNKRRLEQKLKIKITIENNSIIINGEPLQEYDAELVLEAINSGFSIETSLETLKENTAFERINIKDYTSRKDISVIRGRIIGTNGRTKKTLEQLTGCKIKINDNVISIIGNAEEVKNIITAIIKIIKGSKQSKTYKFLERINTKNKNKTNQT